MLSDADAATPPAFADFALGVYPFLDLKPFHRAYYRVLEAFAAGRVRRLIVTMPPQHGKSVGATTLLPAYVLGLDPDCRVAIASYSGALASKFNRRVQRILCSAEYVEIQPPCPAYHRVARIRRLFPRYDDQARRPAAGLYPHGRRGGGRGAAGRTAVGRTRGLAHGQPRGLLHPGRFV